jgi:radical SAM superfamily enzyme YgiQ (UPF0313 family)
MEMNREIYKTPMRTPLKDLDRLPFVNRSLINCEKYNRFIGQAMVKDSIALQATRGCPYGCAFCHKIWPKTHAKRSAKNIFDEVKLYYDMGIKRFVFVDDIFNLDKKNSSAFFEMIIRNNLDVQLLYPNGLRCDLLTKDYIDLMVEAGTSDISFALDTASPRLQKFIGKNLNIEKFRENIEYACAKYPELILEFQVIHGFPTETEEEAMMSLEFIKSLKWLDFPYIHILKIFPNTDMEQLALRHGISAAAIRGSLELAFDELDFDDRKPSPLPFPKSFTMSLQTEFLHNYLLLKERLLHVLPYQMKRFTRDELVQKYDSFLPFEITSLEQLLEHTGITKEELSVMEPLADDAYTVPDLDSKIAVHFPTPEPDPGALKVLLMDLSTPFSHGRKVLYNVVEHPLGPMSLLTYLHQELAGAVNGKIIKSRLDFDDYPGLKKIVEEFKPQIIGIRTLTIFKKFFHETIQMLREWGIDAPIVAGGPYATSEYNSILQDNSVDLVVMGEGEITFCELISKTIANDGILPGRDILREIQGMAYLPGIIEQRIQVSGANGNALDNHNSMLEERRNERLTQFIDDLENE